MNLDYDIVTLLRKYQPYNKLHGQAADEIERLREENTELKDARIDLQAVENIVGSVQDLLLAARRQYDTHLIQKDLIVSKDDEIERLRQQVDLLSKKLTVVEERAERWERAAKVLACAFEGVEERRHAWRFVEDTEAGR